MTNDDPTRLWGDPSPDEIRERCEAIRAEWTEAEEAKRRAWSIRRWTPPAFRTAHAVRSPATFKPSRTT